jgi:NAD(P)-dependent dehydrogenase (short-subunit alcohol dehydrogenase family)
MFQSDLLKNKVILVTGGGTGLGRSMVKRFLELGAKVAISSRREGLLQEEAKNLTDETGGEVFPVQVDVRDPEKVTAMIDAVETHFGHIDVLVNNAAGNFISPTERLSHRAVDAVLGIVLHGTMYCTLELGKRWIEKQHKGNVLNIATTYALSGSGYVVPSAVAKAGVVTMTKSLAAEWGKYGIRLNAIAPGPFPTEGAWSRLMPTPEIEELFQKRIPLKRVGEHLELANLASYLVSDQAGFITGDVITIDGGETVWGAGEFNILDEVTKEQWDELERKVKSKK